MVYRARDTKLERDVAVKRSPEELAADEERIARFEREAQLLASLNHPNIASIHGFEESDGVKALVLELFYRSRGSLMVVAVGADGQRNASPPRVILEAETLASYQGEFDVSPDAQRFLVTQEDRESRRRSLEVVLNWTAELKRLVPTEH